MELVLTVVVVLVMVFVAQLFLLGIGISGRMAPGAPRKREEYLTGYYTYGALSYGLLGAAAVDWKRPEVLGVVFTGLAGTIICYGSRYRALETDSWALHTAILFSWIAPTVAVFMLTFG